MWYNIIYAMQGQKPDAFVRLMLRKEKEKMGEEQKTRTRILEDGTVVEHSHV